MKNLTYLVLLTCFCFFISSCNTSRTSSPENLTFKVIESGAYGGISVSSQSFINDKTEYDQLFADLKKNIYPLEYPAYSPNKSYIFITLGKQSSGGLNYEVNKVENINNKIIVTLKSLSSGGLSIGTQAIANPYIVIETKKTTNREIELIKE